MPVIAIVGRPNVGKSSLMNALIGKRISIVQDMPGVTRDRISYPLPVDGRYVELIDTGGYGFDDPDLFVQIKHQIDVAMSLADMVLFVVDCQDGLTPADQEIAALLRKRELKTALVANKADSEKADVALAEFAKLGFGTPIGVSALRERNLELVIAAIRGTIDFRTAPKEIPEPQMMVAIVGKRNSGKSTLVNSIAHLYEGDTDRVIVSEVPGTTRDSVDVRFDKEGKTLIVIDTAGVRKRRHMVTNDIEFYSFHRAQRSIRRADIVFMLMDGTEPASEPDKKLAQYISEQHKPVIIVINKWDLARKAVREQRGDLKTEVGREVTDVQIMEEYRQYIVDEMPYLAYAPVEFITAKDGRNVQQVLDTAQHLFRQANERLGTGRLNRAIRQILEERLPSTPGGHRPKIYYATQTDTAPPTIVLFVNNPKYIDEPYKRFMINRMRNLLPFSQVPIRLVLRGREKGQAPGSSLEEAPEGMEQIEGESGRAPEGEPRTGSEKRLTVRGGRQRGAPGNRGSRRKP